MKNECGGGNREPSKPATTGNKALARKKRHKCLNTLRLASRSAVKYSQTLEIKYFIESANMFEKAEVLHRDMEKAQGAAPDFRWPGRKAKP